MHRNVQIRRSKTKKQRNTRATYTPRLMVHSKKTKDGVDLRWRQRWRWSHDRAETREGLIKLGSPLLCHKSYSSAKKSGPQ